MTSRRINISLGTDEAERRKAALERIAAEVGAIGYHKEPAISKLFQMIADGELKVTRMSEYLPALGTSTLSRPLTACTR